MSYNVLLDNPPEEFEGYRINTDFRIGIQISLVLTDPELYDSERMAVCYDLLFGQEKKAPVSILSDAVEWLLSGWFTDKVDKHGKHKAPVMDMNTDQWRIFSAFLSQYRIDLRTADLHYWEFMGLLSTLDECAFTRIVDIRSQDIPKYLKGKDRTEYSKMKQRFALEAPESVEEQEERTAAREKFMSMVQIKRKKDE